MVKHSSVIILGYWMLVVDSRFHDNDNDDDDDDSAYLPSDL